MKEGLLHLLGDARRVRNAGRPIVEQRRRDRLAEMVAFARNRSPYYRELYRGLPERVEDPVLLPPTSKQELMSRFGEWCTDPAVTLDRVRTFIDDPALIGENFMGRYTVFTTSGTTGRRGLFVLDERCLNVTRALTLLALRRWLSTADIIRILTRGIRTAMVIASGGHFASSVVAAGLRRQLGGRIEILSVRSPLAEIVARLNRSRPVLLATYASLGALLASEQEAGRLHLAPALVVLTAEGLPQGEFGRIAGAFRSRVGNAYLAAECLFLSSSCDQGWLHVNSDWAVLEPVDANYRPVPPGELSHTVLISNLANHVQPILRYDLGDSVLERPDPCPCGNPLPAIRVQGRAADIVTMRGATGGQVKLVPLAFTTTLGSVPGIELAQVVQVAPATLRLRLRVDADTDPERTWRSALNALENLLAGYGIAHVHVERAKEEPVLSSGGKYRAVIPLL